MSQKRKIKSEASQPPSAASTKAASSAGRTGWREFAKAGVLVAFVLVAFLPALQAGFIWDDDRYVTENPLLTAPDGLWRIWFTAHTQSQYFPLVYTTFRFEHSLWGLHPFGYHFVNVLLHAVNGVLVWQVLKRLAVPGAWLAAALFAVHPVQVETVAWVTELKNLESTLFYLLAVLAWMRFTGGTAKQPWKFYWLALGLYLLALFAKTTACTLPAALVLVLWMRKEPVDRRRWVQIAPFVVIGVAMGLLSVWWEGHLGNYREEAGVSFSLWERVIIASRAIWFYAAKLAWPWPMSFSYPRWEINTHDPAQYVWVVLCLAAVTALWLGRKRLNRSAVAGIVFFVAALSPLLGVVSNYTFRYSFVADHYQYLACAGLFAVLAGGFTKLAAARGIGAAPQWIVAGLMLCVLGGLTWQHAGIYRDEETLWSDTIRRNPNSWLALNNLGYYYYTKNRIPEAIDFHRRAIQVNPAHPKAYNNLGVDLAVVGRLDEARPQYEKAVELKPDYSQARYNLGLLLANQRQLDGALEQFEQALKYHPEASQIHFARGAILREKGRLDEAVREFEIVLERTPNSSMAHENLGEILAAAGKFGEAETHYRKAIELEPNFALPRNALGNLLLQQRRMDEAIFQYRKYIELKPDDFGIHVNLALALAGQGKSAEARAELVEALRLKPDSAQVRDLLQKLDAAGGMGPLK